MAGSFTDGVGNKYVLQETISAYADEAYTDASRLSNSGFVSPNDTINTDDETFIGQMRWRQPIDHTINVASLTDATDGVPTNYSTTFLRYIKTVRTSGSQKVNLSELVAKEDGLEVFADSLVEGRTRDESDAVLAILKGVALAEAMRGATTSDAGVGLGGQTFDNDPENLQYGFYVDLGANPIVSTSGMGASRIEDLIEAFGMAWKDYEPEFAYLVANPMLMAGLRSANMIDEDRVTDGSIDFETILSGKLRLVKSRVNTSFSSAELAAINGGAGVDIVGTKTSFIVTPGAMAMEPVNIPMPVGIDEDEAAYHGGGTTEAWYRWGYVAHPQGYDWVGPTEKFPSNSDYQAVEVAADTPVAVTDASVTADVDAATPYWDRKTASALTLGILPIFHG